MEIILPSRGISRVWQKRVQEQQPALHGGPHPLSQLLPLPTPAGGGRPHCGSLWGLLEVPRADNPTHPLCAQRHPLHSSAHHHCCFPTSLGARENFRAISACTSRTARVGLSWVDGSGRGDEWVPQPCLFPQEQKQKQGGGTLLCPSPLLLSQTSSAEPSPYAALLEWAGASLMLPLPRDKRKSTKGGEDMWLSTEGKGLGFSPALGSLSPQRFAHDPKGQHESTPSESVLISSLPLCECLYPRIPELVRYLT